MKPVVLSPHLASILRADLEVPRGALGPTGSRKTIRSIEARMAAEASHMNKMFYAALVMILAAYSVMLFLLVVNANNPGAFTAISGASGLTLAGLIWFALRTAREASQASLLLVLVTNLPSEHALTAIEAILNRRSPSTTDADAEPTEKRT